MHWARPQGASREGALKLPAGEGLSEVLEMELLPVGQALVLLGHQEAG